MTDAAAAKMSDTAAPPMIQADYEKYPARVANLRARYRDFPRTVSIETLVRCNAKCGFCPYPTSSRIGDEMPTELVTKIIDDLSAIPLSHAFQITLCRINEPLLDRRLEAFHDRIAEKLPQAKVGFWSNGTTLRPGKFEWMARHRSASLSISLNAINEEDHIRLMGFGLSRVLQNLDYLHDLKVRGRFPLRVTLCAPFESREQAQELDAFCRERWPEFVVGIRPFFEWVGGSGKGADERDATTNRNVDSRSALNLSCGQWFDLHVLANGYAARCCIDETGFVDNARFDLSKRNALDVYREGFPLRNELPDRSTVSGCEGCRHLG